MMNDQLTIRRASLADAQVIAEFNIAMASETEDKQLENFISESKRILKKHGILAIAIPVVAKKNYTNC